MIFTLDAFDPSTRRTRHFEFDNAVPTLTENGEPVSLDDVRGFMSPEPPPVRDVASTATHPSQPRKKARVIERLLIQMGVSCNYSCSYCSQASLTSGVSGNPSDVPALLAMLRRVRLGQQDTGKGVRVELWGGEPLVYWKTLKPLVEAMRARYPDIQFTMITNGSLLTLEKVDWIEKMHFGIAISHDGPGQHFRGPDPFDDPIAGAAILDLYQRLRPFCRISFSSMLHVGNYSRKAIVDFFVEKTGDPFVPISEGGFISPYDNQGMDLTPHRLVSLFTIRKALYEEIVCFPELAANYWLIREDVQRMIRGLAYRYPLNGTAQICGKDREDTATIDMEGNVLTCQIVNRDTVATNGNSHKIGHITDVDSVALNTSLSWHHREGCKGCPVLRMCGGRCMFLDGAEFAAACEASYTEKVAVLAIAFKMITGCQLLRINAPHLPLHRQILWDAEHEELALLMSGDAKEASARRHKVIPIVAVSA